MNEFPSILFQNVFFWILIGSMAAMVFGISQKYSLVRSADVDAQHVFTTAMLSSALRVLVSIIILFFAFRTGIRNGIACLFTFIVIRWVFLLFFVKSNRKALSKPNPNREKSPAGSERNQSRGRCDFQTTATRCVPHEENNREDSQS